jgi:hypothetical protein
MPGEIALLCPMDRKDAVSLSRTMWRKQVLPLGTIDYKGRRITFDQQYLTDLAASFKDQAFDQVAFLLAKDDNSHTMDPERFRGEVKGMEVTPQGLDVLLDLTPDAAKLVRKNPKLGVSARIIEGLDRADGKKFPRAIQHVLGTLDPRVTGMASWQEVTLSEEVGDTLDITEEEVQMTVSGEPTVKPAPTPNPPVDPNQGLTDAEVQAIADQLIASGEIEEDEDEDLDTLKEEVTLSRAANEANASRIEILEAQLAHERYVAEARLLIDSGVPPVLVELARPVLEMPHTAVIELSNNEQVDVQALVRDMLDQTKGFLELARERGHSFTGNTQEDKEQAILDAWKM